VSCELCVFVLVCGVSVSVGAAVGLVGACLVGMQHITHVTCCPC